MLLTKLKTALAGLMVAALLALGLSTVATPAAGKPAALTTNDKKVQVKVKWQYQALTRPEVEKLAPKGSKSKFTDGLNKLGDQGWELIAIEPGMPEPGGLMAPPPPGGPGAPGKRLRAGPLKMRPSTYLFKRPR
jgi:hypothetical protein